MNWSEFRKQLILTFDEDELETLCFDLNLDYDALSGDNKNAKIRELIELMRRHNRMPEFVAVLNRTRPHVEWDGVLETAVPSPLSLTHNGRLWILGIAIAVLAVVVVIVLLVNNGRSAPEIPAEEIAATVETPAEETATATPTSTPSATPTPTGSPTPTATPTATLPPTPIIAPVAAGEYMVLVAQLEPLTSNERDVTRFIVDDLSQILEVAIPFSKARIREYPEIITAHSQAIAVAEETGASVIIWGNYDDEVAEVEVQVGSLAAFPGMLFERPILEQTVNVRARLANPRQESLAPWVYDIIITLEVAADIGAAQGVTVVAETYTILDRTGVAAAPLVGDSVSVRTHRFAEAYYTGDLATGISYLNDALDLSGNALLYYFRGATFIKTREFQKALVDYETAARLGPGEWFNPYEGLGLIALFQNNIQDALTHFEKGVQWQPEQWRSYYYRGLTYFLAGEYDLAQSDLARAIDLEPDVNWPFVFAIQVALRQGNVLEAIDLGNTVVAEFPNPDFGNRALEASGFNATVLGPIISAVTNGLLQQWPQVLLDVDDVIAVNAQIPDVYWIQGFAHCNLENYEAAEAAYTRAIELDPGFVLPYLSRAAVRLQQGNMAGAEEDFQAIENSDLSAEFSQTIPLVRSGSLNCHNFLTFGQ